MMAFSPQMTLVLLHVLAMACEVLSGSWTLPSDSVDLKAKLQSTSPLRSTIDASSKAILGKYKLDELDPRFEFPDFSQQMVHSLNESKLLPDVMEIKQDGDTFSIIRTVDDETSEIKFKLDDEFEDKSLSGVTGKSVFTMPDDKNLIQIHTVGDNSTTVLRDFEDDDKMVAIYVVGDAMAMYRRTYSKIKE